ncbi:MAG: hypothetical protein HRT47_04350 [Candidatus Caenarcaniphilales bacterium]|nr:hypothetical protein [Candidatus Caenarcaniphilales bacterium]
MNIFNPIKTIAKTAAWAYNIPVKAMEASFNSAFKSIPKITRPKEAIRAGIQEYHKGVEKFSKHISTPPWKE